MYDSIFESVKSHVIFDKGSALIWAVSCVYLGNSISESADNMSTFI